MKEIYRGDPIRERCLAFAEHIIKTGETVRLTALRFGKSKSTVHKDVAFRLRALDREKWEEVRRILDLNRSERHIRGGEATRQKYLGKKKARREDA